MKATIFRIGSGSIPVQNALVPGSLRLSVSSPFLIDAAGEKNSASSPRISLKIRRSSSESDFISLRIKCLNKLGSRSLTLNGAEEMGIPGGGMNNNKRTHGGGDGNGNENEGNWCKIRGYYQQMLKLNPTNSLILSNYARYLHEVEGDVVKAEEYYERAILSSPVDGTVLCLYGKLIWETHRNQNRAKSYFQRAIQADPNDCMIMGSYAHFLWESEDEEDADQEQETARAHDVSMAQTVVEAF